MKKIFFTLVCLALPFVFFSCEDEATDTLTTVAGSTLGSMTMEINGSKTTFTPVNFYQKDGDTYMATLNKDNVVAMKLKGNSTTYTLGVMSDNVISSILGGNLSMDKFDNIMAFRPMTSNGEIYIVVAGSCTVSATSPQLKGSFSGKAVTASYIKNLANGGTSVTDILGIITGTNAETVTIKGTFSAVQSDAIMSMFSGLFSK